MTLQYNLKVIYLNISDIFPHTLLEVIFLNNKADKNDLPLGFGMALAQHPETMQRFANMSDAQKSEVISELHNIKSKEEMQAYVATLDR